MLQMGLNEKETENLQKIQLVIQLVMNLMIRPQTQLQKHPIIHFTPQALREWLSKFAHESWLIKPTGHPYIDIEDDSSDEINSDDSQANQAAMYQSQDNYVEVPRVYYKARRELRTPKSSLDSRTLRLCIWRSTKRRNK